MGKLMTQLVSWLSLVFLLLFPLLYLAGSMELDRVKLMMMVATVVWFIATPFWMWKADEPEGENN